MTTKAKSAPPPVAKTLDEQKADFTSEGSPPPGVVGKPMPTPARKTHFKKPKI